MQIRVDIKSVVVGFILGAVVFLAMGQALSGAGKADFGFAVENNGMAVVRANDGMVYVIDPTRAKAETVEHRDGPAKGLALNLNRIIAPKQKSSNK